jgi:beta-N-acetylhexosaminidase
VVTDALEMKAAAAIAGGLGPAAVRALAAGADLLCVGADVDAPLIEEVAAAIVTAIEDGHLPRARVEEAAARAEALARWIASTTAVEAEPPQLWYEAARRAIRVEGSLEGFGSSLVVQIESATTLAQGRVPWGLGAHVNGAEYLRVVAGEVSVEALLEAAGGRPIVLVCRHTHRMPAAQALVEQLAARHPVALVEMGWPSTWRPVGTRAFLTTYGASHANGHAAAATLGLTP